MTRIQIRPDQWSAIRIDLFLKILCYANDFFG